MKIQKKYTFPKKTFYHLRKKSCFATMISSWRISSLAKTYCVGVIIVGQKMRWQHLSIWNFLDSLDLVTNTHQKNTLWKAKIFLFHSIIFSSNWLSAWLYLSRSLGFKNCWCGVLIWWKNQIREMMSWRFRKVDWIQTSYSKFFSLVKLYLEENQGKI